MSTFGRFHSNSWLEHVRSLHEYWRESLIDSDLSERYVPGEGDNPEAFIIGEAPGSDEDVQLRPFVGPSGIVLRQLMELANLRTHIRPAVYAPTVRLWREQLDPNCWLTNVVKYRPWRNRTPTDDEISDVRRWLVHEWRAVGSPKLIIPVGAVALKAVSGKRISILKAAGKCHWSPKGNAIWPMVHPSFGMRAGPQVQELLEQDWERLGVWRNENNA